MNNIDPWIPKTFPEYGYDELENLETHQNLFKALIRELERIQPKSVCDIGCCTGIGFSLLKNRELYAITGIDYIPEFIDIFNSRGFEGLVGDIEKKPFPFGSNKFECVIADSIVEHTLHPRQFTEEVFRILKPGGYCLVAIPNATSLVNRWNMVRGRNPFRPLIDNLWDKSYMKRCAVLYSEREIKNFFSAFVLEKIMHVSIGRGFKKNIQSFVPERFKDVVVAVLRKPNI